MLYEINRLERLKEEGLEGSESLSEEACFNRDLQEKEPDLSKNRRPRQEALVWLRNGQEAGKRKLGNNWSKKRMERLGGPCRLQLVHR